MTDPDYTTDDLEQAYARLLAHQPRVVIVPAICAACSVLPSPAREVSRPHLHALETELQKWGGTIVVSTATLSFCNTEKVFDPASAPSEMGVLSEFVRQQPDTHRSLHPFVSYAARGPLAERICAGVARHAFGPGTPEDRMIELDTCCLSIGAHPRLTCSTIHHVERMSGVPYRYVKEFLHPVRLGETVSREPFYLYVWYRDLAVKRDRNRKLFAALAGKGFEMASATVGRGHIYAYPMRTFYELPLGSSRKTSTSGSRNHPRRGPGSSDL